MSDKLVRIEHTNYQGSNQIAKIIDDVAYSSINIVASVANAARLTVNVIHSSINQYEIDRIQIESSFKTEQERIRVEAELERMRNVYNPYVDELKRIACFEISEESKKPLYDFVKAKMKEELDKLK